MRSSGFLGILCNEAERPWAEEFFELFKTPWEFYRPERRYSAVISTDPNSGPLNCDVLIIYSSASGGDAAALIGGNGAPLFIDVPNARLPVYGNAASFSWGVPLVRKSGSSAAVAVETRSASGRVIRVGYDLFDEVAFLLCHGQPPEQALIPALELHISTLRSWLIRAGVPFIEVLSAPAGYEFAACLTHDVDFIRISDHKFDHTMFGFIRRASVGSIRKLIKRRITAEQCLQNMKSLVSLPAVLLGRREDFWLQDFDRFLDLERDTRATFFFIPYKGRAGDNVGRPHSGRRGAAYDVHNERKLIEKLILAGNEIAVHGIDAWHSAQRGQDELQRIAAITKSAKVGVRMHWLCFDAASPRVLEEAGFNYDSTIGYNDAIGYRAGTQQVFRPHGATTLLELPLHIQDCALFYEGRFGVTDERAWKICEAVLANAANYGGAVTILWHTRSLAPERLWGGFYMRLLNRLRSRRVWFGTAAEIVEWFRGRRALSFHRDNSSSANGRVAVTSCEGRLPGAQWALRIHEPGAGLREATCGGEQLVDLAVRRWDGESLHGFVQ
jgi:hypothetical protein